MKDEHSKSKWKQIQANMALEGHYITDRELEEVARNYELKNGDAEVDLAFEISQKLGIPYIEALKQIKNAHN